MLSPEGKLATELHALLVTSVGIRLQEVEKNPQGFLCMNNTLAGYLCVEGWVQDKSQHAWIFWMQCDCTKATWHNNHGLPRAEPAMKVWKSVCAFQASAPGPVGHSCGSL